jgi:hypothetical protein
MPSGIFALNIISTTSPVLGLLLEKYILKTGSGGASF